jgi:hypothetical protein
LVLLAASALALAGDDPAGDDGVERARPATWAEATRDVFDPAWILPESRSVPGVPPERQPRDLARRARELAALRFALPEGAEADPRVASFADLVAACRGYGTDAKARDAFLAKVRTSRPDVWEACGADLLQLGRDEFWRSAKWDPATDHDRDGILTAAPFRADCEGKEPWTKVDADRLCQQGLAVFAADVDAIKTGENDYTLYPSDTGAAYDFIYAVAGSFVAGRDPGGRPFSALRVMSRSDLPFPYSTYDCDLHILNRVGADGIVRCDIYSKSADFHWLAGQDQYVPLVTPAGTFVGTMVVRVYGFDLDDVPDGEGNVREALRASLGNLRRRAEKAFADSGSKPRTLRDSVPDFVVRGARKAE